MFNISFFLSFNYSKNETPVFDCCRKKKQEQQYKVVYKERTSAVSTSKNRKEKSDKK